MGNYNYNINSMFSKTLPVLIGATWASTTANEDFTNTLASCKLFAAKFANTCTSVSTQIALSAVPTATVTCKTTKCPTGTGFSGNEAACSWTRKLCVTCLTGADSKVKVRVQTNNLPTGCLLQHFNLLQTQLIRAG